MDSFPFAAPLILELQGPEKAKNLAGKSPPSDSDPLSKVEFEKSLGNLSSTKSYCVHPLFLLTVVLAARESSAAECELSATRHVTNRYDAPDKNTEPAHRPNEKEISQRQSVVAKTVAVIRSGAVGFIVWLGLLIILPSQCVK